MQDRSQLPGVGRTRFTLPHIYEAIGIRAPGDYKIFIAIYGNVLITTVLIILSKYAIFLMTPSKKSIHHTFLINRSYVYSIPDWLETPGPIFSLPMRAQVLYQDC